jgi:hypothetical protein
VYRCPSYRRRLWLDSGHRAIPGQLEVGIARGPLASAIPVRPRERHGPPLNAYVVQTLVDFVERLYPSRNRRVSARAHAALRAPVSNRRTLALHAPSPAAFARGYARATPSMRQSKKRDKGSRPPFEKGPADASRAPGVGERARPQPFSRQEAVRWSSTHRVHRAILSRQAGNFSESKNLRSAIKRGAPRQPKTGMRLLSVTGVAPGSPLDCP